MSAALLLCGRRHVAAPWPWLSTAERETLERLRFAKRREDWLLGRFAAKQLLARTLAPTGRMPEPGDLARLEVRPNADRAPRPCYRDGRRVPLALSLSHRAGVGLAAVAPADRALGCDLERIEPRDPALVDQLFAPEERRLVAATTPAARPLVATLLWSAKEAALKALGIGLDLDPREVVARPEPAAGAGWSRLGVRTPGRRWRGWWCRRGRFLLAVVVEPCAASPRLLAAPGVAPGDGVEPPAP